MNWINLRTETLRSPQFANAKTGAIETWLRVLAYCCEQENGGRLEGAAKWEDRAWMATCGVTRDEIANAYPLIHDDGVDFFVDAFPSEKQAEVQAKRKAGKKGGKRSASSRGSSTASGTAKGEKARGTEQEMIEYAKQLGLPGSDGSACFHKWQGNGWKNGGAPIKCWRSTIVSWKSAGYLPSQKNGTKPDERSKYKLVE